MEIAIAILALAVAFPYSEWAIHYLVLLRDEKETEGGGDPDAIEDITNRGLWVAGIAGAALWLLLVILVSRSDNTMVQVGLIVLLALGVIGADWLYVRTRFK